MSTIVGKISYMLMIFIVTAIGAFVFLYYIIVQVLHLGDDEDDAEYEEDDNQYD